MDEAIAADVVERLRSRRLFAHVNRRAGVYNVGVRVVIPDGREAIWDNDGAAGLEAMVLRDGVLVGFVPQVPDSDDLDAAAIARLIAGADYDAPVSSTESAPGARKPSDATLSTVVAESVTGAASPSRRGWRDRLRRR